MIFQAYKVVATLPETLEPNSLYAVRVGVGFDLYISDSTGTFAHKINQPTSTETLNSLSSVGGSGSGLDADLLDGYNSTDFSFVTSNVEVISAQKNLTIDSEKYQFLSSASTQIINLPSASTVPNKEFLLVNKGNVVLLVYDNGVDTGLGLNSEGRAFCFSTGINWEIFVDYQITNGINETSTIDGGVF